MDQRVDAKVAVGVNLVRHVEVEHETHGDVDPEFGLKVNFDYGVRCINNAVGEHLLCGF